MRHRPIHARGLAALALLALLACLLGPAAPGRAADEGEKSVLGNLLAKVLSTPGSRVAIGAVDGALSSDATIRDVAVADRDGVWLRLDRARIVWRRLALLSGRLEVDSLELGRLEVLRRPVPATVEAVPEPDGTLLPDLPVKVEVKTFALTELVLGEALAGQPARLSAQGRVKLGAPAEGLDLDASVRRLDAAGLFTARLLFVPKGEKLELKATLGEPAGGVLSKGLSLPGAPPIALDLDGRGTLDAFAARLDLDAGESVGAKGSARVTRAGSERRLALDLAARVEGLLPGPAAAVFAGTTKLDGAVRFPDAGGLDIERIELASHTARLGVRGRLGADRQADFAVEARALPNAGGLTRAGGAELDSLVFDASLKGPLAAPRVAGILKAAGLRGRDGDALERVEADLRAEPAPGAAGRFVLAADGRFEGLALADPSLGRAIGPRGAVAFRGSLEPDNSVAVETLRVESATLNVAYAGRIGRNTLTGRVDAAASDLSAFSGLAGRPLTGRVAGRALLGGDPARRAVTADLDIGAERLALGSAPLDGLIGPSPRLTGRVSQVYDGYGFDGARLQGAALTLTLDGRADARAADARLALALPDLALLDGRLDGAARLEGRLTGSLAHPDLALTLSAPQATALGRPVRGLTAAITARDVTGALDGSLSLAGSLGGKPLAGKARLARPDGRDWRLDGLSLGLGSAMIEGRAAIADATWLVDGALAVTASDLDDLSPLVLTPLAGRIEANLALTRVGPRQDVSLRATGASLRVAGAALARLDADLTGRDLRGQPALSGHLDADRLVAAGQEFDTLRLAARPDGPASDVTLAAKARGFALDGALRLVPGPAPGGSLRIEIARLAAARGADRFALAAPAAIAVDDRGALIEGLSVTAGSGRLDVAGRVGSDLDLRVGLKSLPLALARIARPDLALAGTLDGEAQLHGPAERPEGRFALTLARVVTPETRRAGLPPVEARAAGTLSGGQVRLDGRISAGPNVSATFAGAVPLAEDGALDLAAKGNLEAALVNSLLSAGGQRVTGRVAFDASVHGTRSAPRVGGSATLTGGSFTDPLQGIRLDRIEGRASGQGDALVLERLTAATRNGGTLSARGRVALAPDAGFPGSFTISAQRAELVSSTLMQAVASLDLAVSGPLAHTPRISGRIDVASVDVAVPDRLPATVQPLPGLRRVNTPPEVRARLARTALRPDAAGRKKGRAAAPFDATLDLTVSAPARIFVRGRGIDAELGGDLRVTGTSRDPRATGAFDLRRGRLAVVGQRLDFTRGRVTFGGTLATPDLDFAAETKAGDVTARVAVTGPADAPAFALTSDPTLPQDEVLSRLLFKKAAASLSPFQALQLAQGVAQFSGGGGADVFDKARKGLGLDSLDVSTGTSGGPAVGASRYLSDRLSVGVKAGAKPADTAATIDYDVTRRVKIQGEAGSDGRTSVGVGAEWEY